MKPSVKSRLNDLLKTQEMTSYDLAKRSGIDYKTVQRIVTGETENPSKRTLDPIAKVFGVTADFLISGIKAETELTLLQRALMKLEEQIDRKDQQIAFFQNLIQQSGLSFLEPVRHTG